MINNINIIFPFATTRQRKKGKPPQRGITHQRRMYHRGSISVRDGLGWSMRADKATLQGFHWRLTAGPWPWEGRAGVLWILVSRQKIFYTFSNWMEVWPDSHELHLFPIRVQKNVKNCPESFSLCLSLWNVLWNILQISQLIGELSPKMHFIKLSDFTMLLTKILTYHCA